MSSFGVLNTKLQFVKHVVFFCFFWGGTPAIFLCLVVTFRPRFHSDYLAPAATALSKKSAMVQMFPLINILNCLPPLICVLKHVPTRLTILTGSKNNDKIKVADTLQWPVGSQHSPFGLQI